MMENRTGFTGFIFELEPPATHWKPSTYTPLKYGKVYKYRCDRCGKLLLSNTEKYCFFCYDNGVFLEDERAAKEE